MEFDFEQVQNAYDTALSTSTLLFSQDIDSGATSDTFGLAVEVLGQWPFDGGTPFAQVYAGNVAIAAAARYLNDEPALTPDDLAAFLGVSAWFFNSLKHI